MSKSKHPSTNPNILLDELESIRESLQTPPHHTTADDDVPLLSDSVDESTINSKNPTQIHTPPTLTDVHPVSSSTIPSGPTQSLFSTAEATTDSPQTNTKQTTRQTLKASSDVAKKLAAMGKDTHLQQNLFNENNSDKSKNPFLPDHLRERLNLHSNAALAAFDQVQTAADQNFFNRTAPALLREHIATLTQALTHDYQRLTGKHLNQEARTTLLELYRHSSQNLFTESLKIKSDRPLTTHTTLQQPKP